MNYRALSLIWVVWGHQYLFSLQHVQNPLSATEVSFLIRLFFYRYTIFKNLIFTNLEKSAKSISINNNNLVIN